MVVRNIRSSRVSYFLSNTHNLYHGSKKQQILKSAADAIIIHSTQNIRRETAAAANKAIQGLTHTDSAREGSSI